MQKFHITKKISLLLLILTFLSTNNLYSQEFKQDSFEVKRDSVNAIIYRIEIDSVQIVDSALFDYSVKVETVHAESSMPFPEYDIDPRLGGYQDFIGRSGNFYLVIKSTKLNDPERVIIFRLYLDSAGVKRKELGVEAKIKIIVAKNEPVTYSFGNIKKYKFLGYIGSNFDFVEGVDLNKVFFSANMMLKPKHIFSWKRKEKFIGSMINFIGLSKVGYYLSLSGNRTFSSSDTNLVLARQYSIAELSDSLSIVANEQTIELTTNATNQYMAIMNFPLGISKRVNHNTGAEFHLYFGPFMSFIWRQTQSKLEYGNTSLSTDTIVGKIGNENTFIQLQEATYYTRQFLFNRGISFMIVHESDDISIRVFLYRGKLSTFSPSGQNADEYSVDYDIMFHGQAWITEPHTGLTLQTEIINARNNPKPYFSATLSFAILFSELGKRYATLRNNNLKGPN